MWITEDKILKNYEHVTKKQYKNKMMQVIWEIYCNIAERWHRASSSHMGKEFAKAKVFNNELF